MPQTKGPVVHTPMVVESTSQSEEEGNRYGLGSSSSHSESSSIEASQSQHENVDSQPPVDTSVTFIDPKNTRW